MAIVGAVDVPIEDTGNGGWMNCKEPAVGIAAVVSVESEIGPFPFEALPFSALVITLSRSCDDDTKDALGIGGGCNIISLDVISLNIVCQITSVTLANNTRYSEGKLYVMTFAGVQTLAFAINNGTNLA